jgi:DNA-directed RNA polymerase specialized sigma24 family protein
MHGEAGWDHDFEVRLPPLQRRLRPIARRWVEQEADDLVQIASIALWNALHRGVVVGNWKAFLEEALRLEGLARRRSLARERERMTRLPERSPGGDGTEDAERE